MKFDKTIQRKGVFTRFIHDSWMNIKGYLLKLDEPKKLSVQECRDVNNIINEIEVAVIILQTAQNKRFSDLISEFFKLKTKLKRITSKPRIVARYISVNEIISLKRILTLGEELVQGAILTGGFSNELYIKFKSKSNSILSIIQ